MRLNPAANSGGNVRAAARGAMHEGIRESVHSRAEADTLVAEPDFLPLSHSP